MRAYEKTLTCAVLSVVVSGCSFLFTTAPPEHVTAYTTLDCTTSRAAPVIDSLLGALNGVGTIAENNAGAPTGVVVGDIALTVLLVSSAIYGYSVVSDCQRARSEHDTLIEQEMMRSRQTPQQRQRPPASY